MFKLIISLKVQRGKRITAGSYDISNNVSLFHIIHFDRFDSNYIHRNNVIILTGNTPGRNH